MFQVRQSPEFDFEDKNFLLLFGNFGVRGGEGQGFSRRRKKVAKIPTGYKFEQKWRSHLAILQRSNVAI